MSAVIRILLIEDDPDISDLLQTALEPAFECLRATNGLEGLQIALAGEPDLIISDIMMPIMDGYEFIRRVRREPQFASTPVIFLSALGTREKIREGYDLGAALYLTKPIDPIRMRRNVELFIEDHGVAASPKKRSVQEVQAFVTETNTAANTPAASAGAPEAESASSPAPAAAAEPPKAPRGQRARILVVEDDREGMELLHAELSTEYEFAQAYDGIEAIERAVRYEPDIFVIDGMLPKMTGYQLVTMLKKNKVFRDHPIVMVSAKTTSRDRQYIEKLGVKHFLAKPFKASDLRQILTQIIEEPGFTVAQKKITDKQMALEVLRDFESRR